MFLYTPAYGGNKNINPFPLERMILMGAYELLSLVCSLVQAIVAIILLYFEIKRNKTIDFKKEKR